MLRVTAGLKHTQRVHMGPSLSFFDLDIFAFFRIPDFFCQISSFCLVCCIVEQTEFENRDEGRQHASLSFSSFLLLLLSTIISQGYLLYNIHISIMCYVSYSL